MEDLRALITGMGGKVIDVVVALMAPFFISLVFLQENILGRRCPSFELVLVGVWEAHVLL
jgi:hypothetical protein